MLCCLSVALRLFCFILFPFCRFPFPLCMESASCVFSFRMVFFYLVTTGWICDSSLCVNPINQSINQSSIYACMVNTYSRLWINRVGLPILQSCLWPAKQGKLIFPCPRSCLRVWSRETGSAIPSRVSLLISTLRLSVVLTHGIPPDFRSGVHSFISPTAIDRVSPGFIRSCNRVPMAFTAESPPAQGQST